MTLTYTIKPCRAVFTRHGYEVDLFNEDGSRFVPWLPVQGTPDKRRQPTLYAPCPMPASFFGNNGHKVRAQATAWARSFNAVPRPRFPVDMDNRDMVMTVHGWEHQP